MNAAPAGDGDASADNGRIIGTCCVFIAAVDDDTDDEPDDFDPWLCMVDHCRALAV